METHKVIDLLESTDTKVVKYCLKRTRKLNINKINSFINGITRDIDSVKDAIRYEYNTRLAEGYVDNFKLLRTKAI